MIRVEQHLFFAALVTLLAFPAVAADDPARPWTDAAEVSAVITSGNTETKNVALANKFIYNWSAADLTVDAAALRTESDSTTTAEAYQLGGKYRRTIRDNFLWYTLAGWDRNRFAGITDRYTAGGGVGYRFFKDDLQALIGELGVDYTDESRTGGTSDSFAGARAFLGYDRKLSETSSLATSLEVLENLSDTEDLRAKWITGVTASLSSRLALKVGYAMLYDRQPVEVLVGAGPAVIEFDDVDTMLSASLVINF